MTPTRGRPDKLQRMAQSARETAVSNIEIIVWLDSDDPQLNENLRVCREEHILYQIGPRKIIHSARWDMCLPLATGDLLVHVNDDVVFQTPGWDTLVENFFAASLDKLWVVGGDDAYLRSRELAPHPIVHRRWVDTLGYFIPRYFDGEYGDTWVSDLARRIGRLAFLPFVVEHFHFSRPVRDDSHACPKCGEKESIAAVAEGNFCNRCGTLFGKSRIDQTARDYIARNQAQNPSQIFSDREAERVQDAQKLRVRLWTPWTK